MSKNGEMSIEQEFQKKELREHILLRPDSYVGSTSKITDEVWVKKKDRMVMKPVTYSKALISIFNEILVNALDQSTKKPVRNIEIFVDRETNTIRLKNDGPGIKTDFHKEYKMHVPQLIFGELLTGTNYNDNEKRYTGGRNGYGAKCTNIYSNYFKVHTFDGKNEYSQEWRNNMTECDPPEIKKGKGKQFTEITFIPDLKRFGFKEITKGIEQLFEKRAYDACACTAKNVKVSFNGKELKVKEFKRYIDLYIGPERVTGKTKDSAESSVEPVKRIYLSKEKKDGAIWELGIAMNPSSDSKFQQVSFVNGISTDKGGKHIDYIVNPVITKLIELIKKKKSTVNISRSWIRDRLFVFLRTTIVNPKFTSQTKEELETPYKEFDFEFDIEKIDPKVIEKIGKLGILDEALAYASYKETREIARKSDGKKRSRIHGIPKLKDANLAGTRDSDKCTLCLVEGDSAASIIEAGISAMKNGRDYYGLFPLKGKIVNVKTANNRILLNNKEITEIKQIIGLKQDKEYKSTKELRYGKVMFICDQDPDGSHIKGLGLNLFHHWWKSLMKLNYIECLATPLIRATKGKGANFRKMEFYSMTEYNQWKEATSNSNTYKIKYYKGLATNDQKDAKEMFKDGIDNKKITYQFDKKTDASMDLAFSKEQADNRKVWLGKYNRNDILTQEEKTPSVSEFITKELVHFSVYDNERSIPSVIDGLKPSQRKILYGCFKRNLVSEIKVAQLAGYISEQCGYHHGEASLNGAIVKMAQSFVGSNNLPLLEEHGMFGTRNQGGADAGQPRYIYTSLSPHTRTLFNSEDSALLNYREDDDGNKIEPDFFVPTIPMILVNGAKGIGTGFSCEVPCFSVKDIVGNLIKLMEGKEQDTLIPNYNNFKGTITETDKPGSYKVLGKWERIDKYRIYITELPIGTWTQKYKEFLEDLLENGSKKDSKKDSNKDSKKGSTSKSASKKEKGGDTENIIGDYKEHHKENTVKFEIEFTSKEILDELIESNTLEKEFKLIGSLSTNNMYLFDHNLRIKKYNTPNEIISEFYKIRKLFYKKRYKFLKEKYKTELEKILNKVRFIEEIIESTLVVFRKPKKEIIKQLTEKEYAKFDDSFDYLVNLPIHTFTKEKIKDLKEQEKSKQETYNELLSKEPIDLWKEDLVELL